MSRSFAGLVLATGLVACSNLTFEDRQELRFAEGTWESRGFGDYSIEVSRGCFCPPVEGLFETIRDTEHGVEFEFDETLGYPTVIHWFSPPDVLDAGGIDRLRNAVPLP